MHQDNLDLHEVQSELELQNEITRIFAVIPNGEMYSNLLDLLLEIFESKDGFIGYVDRKKRLICPSMTKDARAQYHTKEGPAKFPRDCWAGIWGRAMKDQIVLCSNESADVPKGHIPINNALCAPIIHLGELIGCVAISNKPVDYTSRDVILMEMIATRIAPLLHARLQRDDALEALQEAAHRAETYLKLAPAVFVALDAEGNITMVNDYGSRVLGCDIMDCIGLNWFDNFIAEEAREEVREVFNNLMSGEIIFHDYENAITTTRGDKRIVMWKNTILKDDTGKIIGTLSAGDDITEQRVAEEELEKYWENQEKLLSKGLENFSLLNGSDGE